MRISEVTQRKGSAVVTAAPTMTVAEVVALLVEHRIGALVVTDDGDHIAGIVSERDIVQALHERGAAVLDATVGELMTTTVQTCVPDDELESLARKMTEHRVRHLPVVEDERLVAIVSIGDVVKHRLDELTDERNQLVSYVQTSSS